MAPGGHVTARAQGVQDSVDERPRALAAHGLGSALACEDRTDALELWNPTAFAGQDVERYDTALALTVVARDWRFVAKAWPPTNLHVPSASLTKGVNFTLAVLSKAICPPLAAC
eukprot:7561393-Pyramimonas_sp.AAC.1